MPPKRISPKTLSTNVSSSVNPSIDCPEQLIDNPALCYAADEITEVSQEEIIPQLNQLVNEGESFERVVSFYLDRRNFTEFQTKKWLEKFNQFREARSLSSVPGELETSDSTFKVSEADTDTFLQKLYNRIDWDLDSFESSGKLKVQSENYETSSDSNCETEINKNDSSQPCTRSSSLKIKNSWKEYKKRKNVESFLNRKTENTRVNTLVNMARKELWKKKKTQGIDRDENKVIEIDRIEVADMIYEVTDHMAKKYLPKIMKLAKRIDPGSNYDKASSESESGSYDSQDNYFPNKEDKRSVLPKIAMSLRPDVLVSRRLSKILLLTLPLCSSYTDEDQLSEFIEILKEAEEYQGIPQEITLRGVPEIDEKKEKPIKARIVATRATVEASPSLDTLAEFSEPLPRDDDNESTSSRSTSASIRQILGREILKSVESEESQSMDFIDDSDSNIEVYKTDSFTPPERELDNSTCQRAVEQAKRDRSPEPQSPSKKSNK